MERSRSTTNWARDVAFPVMNNISFWLFFVGMILFNLSFIIGGSPAAGWTNYAPLAGEFSQAQVLTIT